MRLSVSLLVVLGVAFGLGGCAPAKDRAEKESERVEKLKALQAQGAQGFVEQIRWVADHAEQGKFPDVDRVLLKASDYGVSEAVSDGLEFVESLNVDNQTRPFLVIPVSLPGGGGRTLEALKVTLIAGGVKEAHLTTDGTYFYLGLEELVGPDLFSVVEATVQEWKMDFSISKNDAGEPGIEESSRVRIRIRGPNPLVMTSQKVLAPEQIGKAMVNWGSGGVLEIASEVLENRSDRSITAWLRIPENGASLQTLIQSNHGDVIQGASRFVRMGPQDNNKYHLNWVYRGDIQMTQLDVTDDSGAVKRLRVPETSVQAGFVALPIGARQKLKLSYLAQSVPGGGCSSPKRLTQASLYSPSPNLNPGSEDYFHGNQSVVAMDSVGRFQRSILVTEKQEGGTPQSRHWSLDPWLIAYSNVQGLGRLTASGSPVSCKGFPKSIDSF